MRLQVSRYTRVAVKEHELSYDSSGIHIITSCSSPAIAPLPLRGSANRTERYGHVHCLKLLIVHRADVHTAIEDLLRSITPLRWPEGQVLLCNYCRGLIDYSHIPNISFVSSGSLQISGALVDSK